MPAAMSDLGDLRQAMARSPPVLANAYTIEEHPMSQSGGTHSAAGPGILSGWKWVLPGWQFTEAGKPARDLRILVERDLPHVEIWQG